jgi:hypothetical protein
MTLYPSLTPLALSATAGYALWQLLGPTSIFSMVVMIAQLPAPAKLASLSLGIQRSSAKAADERVGAVVEAISALRITKAFGEFSPRFSSIDQADKVLGYW